VLSGATGSSRAPAGKRLAAAAAAAAQSAITLGYVLFVGLRRQRLDRGS
jgi:hypothetical protein